MRSHWRVKPVTTGSFYVSWVQTIPLMHFSAVHGSQKNSFTPSKSSWMWALCCATKSSLTALHEFTLARSGLFRCSILYSVMLKDAYEGTILLQKLLYLAMSQNRKETILSCLLWLRINFCPFDLFYMYLVVQWLAACRSWDFYYSITYTAFIYSWRVNNLLFYSMCIFIYLVRI